MPSAWRSSPAFETGAYFQMTTTRASLSSTTMARE
jgi:hypothetical protein